MEGLNNIGQIEMVIYCDNCSAHTTISCKVEDKYTNRYYTKILYKGWVTDEGGIYCNECQNRWGE